MCIVWCIGDKYYLSDLTRIVLALRLTVDVSPRTRFVNSRRIGFRSFVRRGSFAQTWSSKVVITMLRNLKKSFFLIFRNLKEDALLFYITIFDCNGWEIRMNIRNNCYKKRKHVIQQKLKRWVSKKVISNLYWVWAKTMSTTWPMLSLNWACKVEITLS
jgi:hypothetical protein